MRCRSPAVEWSTKRSNPLWWNGNGRRTIIGMEILQSDPHGENKLYRTSVPVWSSTLRGWYSSAVLIIPSYLNSISLKLALLFMFPTPFGDAGWSTCGLAIRFALEVGAHRKQYIANKPKQDRIEAELWRRAFWNIVTTDLVMSIALGRPRSVKEDE